MDTSTVTQKGQVTIPASIRKKLGLRTGDKVSFHQVANQVVVKPVHRGISASFGIVKARKSASLADIEAAIRKQGRK